MAALTLLRGRSATIPALANPDAVLNLRIDYLTVATDMSADADVSVIRPMHTTVLVEGAKAQAYSFMDDNRYANSVNIFTR